jgi:hypothetical protein
MISYGMIVLLYRIISAIGQNDIFDVQLPDLEKSHESIKSGLQYLVTYSHAEKNIEIENDLISIQRNINKKAKTVIQFKKISFDVDR